MTRPGAWICARLGERLATGRWRRDALASAGPALQQLLSGLSQLPAPLYAEALVISDNGDLYGTVNDLQHLHDDCA